MATASGDLRSDYLSLSRILGRLADAAHAEDIEGVMAMQAEHDAVMARIQANGTSLADLDDADEVAGLMRRALQDIRAAAPQIKSLQDKLIGDASNARMHRKVSQSYR